MLTVTRAELSMLECGADIDILVSGPSYNGGEDHDVELA